MAYKAERLDGRGVSMKAACVTGVVGLWVYSVFLVARWQMRGKCCQGARARGAAPFWVNVYLKGSGLSVLAWLVLIMG
jgi:hypothetical protein